jgi:hypothetical protein
MRRFNYDDNDEFREDIDKFFNDDELDTYEELVSQEIAMQEAQIDLSYKDLNVRIMRTAVRICEKSFWWSFYSQPTRIKMIADTYKKLKSLEI